MIKFLNPLSLKMHEPNILLLVLPDLKVEIFIFSDLTPLHMMILYGLIVYPGMISIWMSILRIILLMPELFQMVKLLPAVVL